ncbi:MAG: hypothetical protein KC492_31910 [Myxococcales bacterium]|nr:hypothetical protein [Myxococcales bacterium]
MHRLISVLGALALFCGCSSSSNDLTSAAGVGEPCVPHDENNSKFSGFSADEVSVETGTPACQTQLCLINKFQGRVTCPYGATGTEGECPLPGTDPNSSDPADKVSVAVAPQLVDRREDDAVYCSCRCANSDGRTDDGAAYCACPTGFSCEQLLGDVGVGDSASIAGGYCVKAGTNQAPSGPSCSETAQNCAAKYEY